MIKINVPMCILMNIIGILITYTIAVIICQQCANMSRGGEREEKKKKTIDRR